jgi:hypothetical protein
VAVERYTLGPISALRVTGTPMFNYAPSSRSCGGSEQNIRMASRLSSLLSLFFSTSNFAPPYRLSAASLSGVVRSWHSNDFFRYFLRYFLRPPPNKFSQIPPDLSPALAALAHHRVSSCSLVASRFRSANHCSTSPRVMPNPPIPWSRRSPSARLPSAHPVFFRKRL